MLPVVRLGSAEITRLIVGGNPFSGNSHVSAEMDLQMIDFFTCDRIKRTLFGCQEAGIGTMQMRADMHIMRMLREYRDEGGTMNWIAQTAPEMRSFEGNVGQMLRLSPCAIYHHGTETDRLVKAGDFSELHRRLKVLRGTGLPVGLCTHMPEVLYRSEDEGWDVDFYMGCVFNLSRQDRQSSAVTGKSNSGEVFDEEDPPLMYRAIRQTPKPCLAFKILGATRRCGTQGDVKNAFFEAYRSIKPSDAVIVGMYPRDEDQPRLDAEYAREAIRAAGGM